MTTNSISQKEDFIVSVFLYLKYNTRALENSKNITTFCECAENVENDNNELKYVNYECFGITNDEDLSDYKMGSINLEQSNNNN